MSSRSSRASVTGAFDSVVSEGPGIIAWPQGKRGTLCDLTTSSSTGRRKPTVFPNEKNALYDGVPIWHTSATSANLAPTRPLKAIPFGPHRPHRPQTEGGTGEPRPLKAIPFGCGSFRTTSAPVSEASGNGRQTRVQDHWWRVSEAKKCCINPTGRKAELALPAAGGRVQLNLDPVAKPKRATDGVDPSQRVARPGHWATVPVSQQKASLLAPILC